MDRDEIRKLILEVLKSEGKDIITQLDILPKVVKSRHTDFKEGVDVDTISEITSGNGVAIDGFTIKDNSFDLGSDAQGDVYYRGASVLARLAAGTSGKYLKTGGAGANPSWDTPTVAGIDTFYDAATTPDSTTATADYEALAGSSLSVVVGVTSDVILIGSALADSDVNAQLCYLRCAWDTGGTPTYGLGMIVGVPDAGLYYPILAFHRIAAVAAATYTAQLQVKVNAGTGTYYNGELFALVLPN